MSGINNAAQQFESKLDHTFTSGHPGTTGREPFEEPIGGANPANSGTGTGAGLTGEHSHHSHSHHHHSDNTGLTGATSGLGQGQHGTGAGAVGVGSEASRTGGFTGEHSHHSHHHERQEHAGVTGHHSHHTGDGDLNNVNTGSAILEGRDGHHSGLGSDNSRGTGGLTDNLNTGVNTGGAANTELGSRGHHSQGGLTGATAGDRLEDNITHSTHNNSRSERENIREAERSGNPSGGGLSGLTTTDDEFIGRDRKGGPLGAYADSEGPFKGNTSGPGGNTALTGREGTSERNPVAQAENAGKPTGTAPTGTSSHPGVADSTHKEGLVDKVKHAVGL